MKVLDISYSVWETVAGVNDFNVYFQSTGSYKGLAWCGTDEVVYETHVVADTWSGFDETFPSGERTLVGRRDDAIAQIVGVDSVPVRTRHNANNELIISNDHPSITERGVFRGTNFVASGNTTTIEDLRINQEVYLRHAVGWVVSGEFGDTVDVALVDKEDTLGYFQYYGLTVGEDVLELGRMVEDYPVVPEHCECSFMPDNINHVVSGLYLRIMHNNNGDTDSYCGAVFLMYKV